MHDLTINIILGSIIAFFVGGFLLHKRLRKTTRLAKVLKLEIEIKEVLNENILKTLSERAVIIKLHNGGKIYAGVDKFITVIHEAHREPLEALKDDYNQYKVDEMFLRLIQKLLAEKIIVMEAKDLEGSFLKRRFQYENITSLILYKIVETDESLYLGIINTTDDFVNFVGGSDFALIELAINKLRNLYITAKRQKILR